MKHRLLALGGAVVSAALVLLGMIPSLFSLVALVFLPAPFLFLWAVYQPAWLATPSRLRTYLLASVVASGACIALEGLWLAGH